MKFVWLVTDSDGNKYAYAFDQVIRCLVEEGTDNNYICNIETSDDIYAHYVSSRSSIRLIAADSFSWT
jgi:hypothetical protein